MYFGQTGILAIITKILFYIGIPLFIAFIIWSNYNKKKVLKKFGQLELISKLMPSFSKRKRRIKELLLIFGLAFIIIALARPQWGIRQQVFQMRGLDIFIAIDTSKSMDSQDIKPSRLIRAKEAIKTLLSKLKGDRIGLIAFAGSAFVQCPLTTDYNAFSIFLDIINTNLISDPGTNLEEPIRLAMKFFEKKERKYKVLILMTDGESHEGKPIEAAKDASNEGVVIYTVGFGSPSGAPIPVYDENGKLVEYKKDRNGNIITSKLDEETLQKIALETGGAYFRATTEADELDKIYDEIEKMEKKKYQAKLYLKREDRYQYFLLIGILLLSIETVLTDRKRKVKTV